MTAARSPRSAALLVGSTSGTSAIVQSAGQSLSRFLASACTCRCRFPAPLKQWPQLVLDLADPPLQGGTVAVLLELPPGLEDVPGDLETVEAERFLGALAEVGMEGEVAAQVRPADLPPLGFEAVVGAEAVGAHDAGERVAEQSVEVLLAAVGRDPQHRRLGVGRPS